MKSIHLIMLLLLASTKLMAQPAQDTPGERAAVNRQTVYPIFLNKVNVERDFKAYVNLEKVYNELKTKKSSAIVDFSFLINENGKDHTQTVPQVDID